MELFINIILFAILFLIAMKIGEYLAYHRIATGLMALQEIRAAEKDEEIIEARGTAKIEKIGEQYYAYIGNDFVAQGATVDEVHDAVKLAIEKNPNKFIASLNAQASENTN